MCVAVKGALASIDGEIIDTPEDDDDDVNVHHDDENLDEEEGSKQQQTYILKSLCIDTTCCSVVALSSTYTPLRPCLLWMDARSAKEAKLIMDVVKRQVDAGVTASKSIRFREGGGELQ